LIPSVTTLFGKLVHIFEHKEIWIKIVKGPPHAQFKGWARVMKWRYLYSPCNKWFMTIVTLVVNHRLYMCYIGWLVLWSAKLSYTANF